MDKIEIDVEMSSDNCYTLDINNERVLKSDKLGVIVDRIEAELKKKYNIKTGMLSKFTG